MRFIALPSLYQCSYDFRNMNNVMASSISDFDNNIYLSVRVRINIFRLSEGKEC